AAAAQKRHDAGRCRRNGLRVARRPSHEGWVDPCSGADPSLEREHEQPVSPKQTAGSQPLDDAQVELDTGFASAWRAHLKKKAPATRKRGAGEHKNESPSEKPRKPVASEA